MRSSSRPNVRRRVALAGGTALIAAAGVGGYLAMSGNSAVHFVSAAARVAAPAVPITDAPETTTPGGAPEAATPETGTDAADTGANVEQDGNVQSGDQSGPDTLGAADTGPNVAQDGNVQSGDQSGADTPGAG